MRVGTLSWERAGGPPLSLGQRIALLAGAGVLVASHLAGLLAASLGRRERRLVSLADLAPPSTQATRQAETFLRDVASPQMVQHSHRTYWFSALRAQLLPQRPRPDLETLYVAALMHDVGLFDPSPPANEHCFTVGCAREARSIARRAGWDEARQQRMAAAITSNLNPSVSIARFGVEAHFLSLGGQVEVFAQEWKVHPANVAEILQRHPRTGFAEDALLHVTQERQRHPGCRFDCLHPFFPFMVRHSHFTGEERTP